MSYSAAIGRTLETSVPRPRAADPFYSRFAIFLLVLTILGFGPSFFFRPFFDLEPLAPSAIAHGAFLTAWFILFLAQTLLVRNRNIRLHRMLGIGAVVIAAIGTIEFVWLAFDLVARHPADVDPALVERANQVRVIRELSTFVVFPTLVVLAVAFRRKPGVHKRLMLLATILLTGPAITRLVVWPGAIWPELALESRVPATLLLWGLLFASTVVLDWVRYRRVHPAFALGAPAAYFWSIGSAIVMPRILL